MLINAHVLLTQNGHQLVMFFCQCSWPQARVQAPGLRHTQTHQRRSLAASTYLDILLQSSDVAYSCVSTQPNSVLEPWAKAPAIIVLKL